MKNINQGQITKRPFRPNRKAFQAGDFAAMSLGEVQPITSANHKDFFTGKCRKKPHTFLIGMENAVCSRCGFTCRKSELPTDGKA